MLVGGVGGRKGGWGRVWGGRGRQRRGGGGRRGVRGWGGGRGGGKKGREVQTAQFAPSTSNGTSCRKNSAAYPPPPALPRARDLGYLQPIQHAARVGGRTPFKSRELYPSLMRHIPKMSSHPFCEGRRRWQKIREVVSFIQTLNGSR